MAPTLLQNLPTQLLNTARTLSDAGLNRGTAGNASARTPAGCLITPTGLPYENCKPADMVALQLDGSWSGARAPSSEWRIHCDVYASRADAGAILHAHSPFATALACHGREIPAFHYMIARFGGDNIRCARYATFGSAELSAHVITALAQRTACLMAQHGMLVVGKDLDHALALAIELETLCEHYWRACQLGHPPLLAPEEMRIVLEKFNTYGQQRASASGL